MTHYETLGVKQNASDDEIKQAYKKLVKKYHPDLNPNNPQAEAKFKEIAAAYGELSDQGRRAKYDQSLMYGSGHRGGWSVNFDPFAPFGQQGFFTSGLEGVFRKANINNNHITTSITIGFLDAKVKQVKTIKYKRKISCKKCKGTGAKAYHTKPCQTCKGKGVITQKLMGVLHSQQRCSPCKGTGKKIKTPCSSCKDGTIIDQAELNVNIPAGILDGKTLRIPNEGHQVGGNKGDLLIKVRITSPAAGGPNWGRNGANVILKQPIPYPTLVLGGMVEIPTIWGTESVRIPARTKVGDTIMLPGKGFPRLGNLVTEERGVQHILIDLMIPDVHSSEHTSLLQKLQGLYDTPG